MQRLNCWFVSATASSNKMTLQMRKMGEPKGPLARLQIGLLKATIFCSGGTMFEFQEVFASQLTATVFVSASIAILTAYAIAALALCRGLEKPRALGSQPRVA